MDNLNIKNVSVDLEQRLVRLEGKDGTTEEHGMETEAGFMGINEAWLRSGWFAKYIYGYTWFGRPIIQLPDDMIRIQEVIYDLKPDVIIETGIAHGGSLIFYASLCKAMEKGKVIGVDIEIRPHNRKAMEEHELIDWITMIEGDAVSPAIVKQVQSHIQPDDTVLVLLDSCHSKDHVYKELVAYSPMVSVGSYIVATDGIMEQVVDGPRTEADWGENNPKAAAAQFVEENKNFEIVEPTFPFNEGVVTQRVTHWPSAYLKRIS